MKDTHQDIKTFLATSPSIQDILKFVDESARAIVSEKRKDDGYDSR